MEIAKAPLPQYSATILQSLTEGTPENIWPMIVAETAAYYFRQWPSISDSTYLLGVLCFRCKLSSSVRKFSGNGSNSMYGGEVHGKDVAEGEAVPKQTP